MPGITKPVSRLLKLYRECTSKLFKQFSNDFSPRAALQRNGGIWAGMQAIQQAAINRNQPSSPAALAASPRYATPHRLYLTQLRLQQVLAGVGTALPHSLVSTAHCKSSEVKIYIQIYICIGSLTFFPTFYWQISSLGPWTI